MRLLSERPDRNRALRRVLRLAKRLEGARELPYLPLLAAEFDVHVRTIKRDLSALRECGWPLPDRDRA